jgi:hypothetical protein
MDVLEELKNFEYHKLWHLFKCRCSYGSNKSRRALRHLKEHHNLDLTDGDIHIKVKGVFHCECGNTFASHQVSIIYQNATLRRMVMSCEKCSTKILPEIKCGNRLVSDNVLALLCRWKLTMKLLNLESHYSGQFHKGLDHKTNLCEACQLGICANKKLVNYDPENFFHVKNFNPMKHQVVSRNKQFDVATINDSIVSGATSL